MSAKWRRVRAWDDEFFPSWAWPIKGVLRAFSSITLAVVLLSFVALYGALASVPVGLMALGLTWAVYVATLVGVVLVGAVLPAVVVWFLMKRGGAGMGARFGLCVPGLMLLAALASWAWYALAWPALHYDPVSGEGLRLFPEFAAAYSGVTVRRLPGFEMTELEFYSWWPMRLALLLFVTNMIVATVRRIEFSVPRIGVLTVHTGIVTIALGSVYYQALKKEGDTILIAGAPSASGDPTMGSAQRAFYDNVRTALYVSQFRGWQQRVMSGVPRYNPYALGVSAGETAWALSLREEPWSGLEDRELDLEVRPPRTSGVPIVDPDIGVRVVGYAPYAEGVRDWVLLDPLEVAPGAERNPLSIVKLSSRVPDSSGAVDEAPVFAFTLLPRDPAHRIADNRVMGVEYLPAGTSDERWADLSEEIPGGAEHGLVVAIPQEDGERLRAVLAVAQGSTHEVGGYRLTVTQILPEPPFAIVTEGYQGSTSSVAVVRVEAPEVGGKPAETFDRYCYFRFPEITQDLMVGEDLPDGRPSRRDADPRIELSYIDHSQVQVFFGDNADGTVRAMARAENGVVREAAALPVAGGVPVFADFVPQLDLRIAVRHEHAEAFDRPVPVDENDRENQFIGTHDKAMLAVEVSAPRPGGGRFTRVVWLPFSKYLGIEGGADRRVDLPDGRSVELLFGRAQHRLPGFQLRLVDFEMVAYDHRGAPRDYRSIVRVEPIADSGVEAFTHETKLNAPLTAPFNVHDAERPAVMTFFGRLATGLSPNQYKFSQAGWDRAGWEATQEAADRGEMARPVAAFTILGVGNNPGIHIIALGGVMMAVGIPWAFYLKPWLMQREKRRLQARVAAEAVVESSTEESGEREPEAVGA